MFILFVFGTVVNVALGKPADQISYINDNSRASKALDGIFSTNLPNSMCAFTRLDTNPWWGVDLVEAFTVAEVNYFRTYVIFTFP